MTAELKDLPSNYYYNLVNRQQSKNVDLCYSDILLNEEIFWSSLYLVI